MTIKEAIEILRDKQLWKRVVDTLDPRYMNKLSGAVCVAIDTMESPRDWTPCAEGLPKKETDNVLICYLDKYGFAEVGIGWYWVPNGKWYNEEKGNAIDVLAWQPLPAPYRADDTTGKVIGGLDGK
ncbi:MAG: hypothetical protein EOM37_12335 [Proteobacteria bacterium]|nr:hypothetical protein [Pseudomonadota bacterium]